MIHILKTKNKMTTTYYYNLLSDAFQKIGEEVKEYEYGDTINANTQDIILAGGISSAAKFMLCGYKNIIVWFQGVVPEERKMQGCSSLRVLLMNQLEKYVVKHAKISILVSETMKHHYENKYGVKYTDKNCIVIPCFNEEKTCDACFSEGIKKPLSFVYAGGMGVWQCFDKTMRVYAALERRYNGLSSLLVLTNCCEAAKKTINQLGIKNYTVKYAEQEELCTELEEQRYGFVLREDNIVNNVATPTKLSTYIAYGVVPICSSTVVDFSNVTQDNNYVIHLNSEKDDEIATEIQHGVNLINSYYSSENIKKEYDQLFADYYNTDKYKIMIASMVSQIIGG